MATFKPSLDKLRQSQEQVGWHEWHLERTDLGGNWEYYDSNLFSYENFFKRVLPENKNSMLEFLRERLSLKAGRAIGLDIGGPGTRLFNDLRGLFGRTAGLVIKDWRKHDPPDELIRTMATRGMGLQESLAMDKRNRNTVLEANVFSNKGLSKVGKWLEGEKADVLFEKLEGAIWHLPAPRLAILQTLNGLYQDVGENGSMFLQLPVGFGDAKSIKQARAEMDSILQNWEGQVNHKFQGRLEVKVVDRAVRIDKLTEPPVSLPAF